MKVPRERVEQAIASARSPAQRVLYLGALLAAAIDAEVIIVGGSAVDVYASGIEPSLDVDLVIPEAPISAAERVVQAWGFVRSGRRWRREDWELDLDFVGPRLSGSYLKTQRFSTPYGPVRVLGVEDLIAKRLVELKHWTSSPEWREQLLRQVSALFEQNARSLDHSYLEFVARRDDIVDILAQARRGHSRP